MPTFGVIVDKEEKRYKCMDGKRTRGMLDALQHEANRCMTALGLKTEEQKQAFRCGVCAALSWEGLGGVKDVFKAIMFLATQYGLDVVPPNFDMVGIQLKGKVV